MKEAVIYAYIWASMAGALSGTVVYNLANPQPKEYRDNMYKATTYTGRGQFRCQIGC